MPKRLTRVHWHAPAGYASSRSGFATPFGPGLEQRDALDVRRLREQVDRAHALELVAGLDELRGVGRERRRVAGDVDDPLRRGLDDPAHDLLREAGARRVDDATSGRPARSTSSRIARRMSPAKKDALVISLSRAFSIASATAGLDDLHADDLARAAGQRQADRADAAVEVEDALVAAQRRRTRPRCA